MEYNFGHISTLSFTPWNSWEICSMKFKGDLAVLSVIPILATNITSAPKTTNLSNKNTSLKKTDCPHRLRRPDQHRIVVATFIPTPQPRVQEDVSVLSLKTGSLITTHLPSFSKYPESLINFPVSSNSSAYLPEMFVFILLSIFEVVEVTVLFSLGAQFHKHAPPDIRSLSLSFWAPVLALI